MKKPLIGFIGQGWIGKNYADSFERRGFKTVRYSLEQLFIQNRNRIKECGIVFIAVPTPTKPKKGSDSSVVEEALKLVGDGKVAIIKSTVLPGTTQSLQKKHPKKKIFYSPEFLSEATAKFDVENPFSNIAGVAKNTPAYRKIAKYINSIIPKAPFNLICTSTEAELIKYSHNISGYTQIILFNIIFDIARKMNVRWDIIEQAIKADPFISNRYSNPIHKKGRGAGGGCFIKDFEAFLQLYSQKLPKGKNNLIVLRSLRNKNLELLISSKKDIGLITGIYGNKILKKKKK